MRRLWFLHHAAAACGLLLIVGCGDGSRSDPAGSGPPPRSPSSRSPLRTSGQRPLSPAASKRRTRSICAHGSTAFSRSVCSSKARTSRKASFCFVIEKGLYQAAVDEAQAGVEKAEATLKLAELEIERQTELFKRNVAAKAKLDEVDRQAGRGAGRPAGAEGGARKGEAAAQLHRYHARRLPAASAALRFRSATSSGRRAARSPPSSARIRSTSASR